jgi:drug/metabolite transporter (DMT)-like permease
MACDAARVQPLDRAPPLIATAPMPERALHILSLLAVGAMWGLTPSLAKLVMAEGMRPLGVATLAATVSAACLFAVAAARGERPAWSARHVLHYAGGGVVGMSLAHFFAFTGLLRAPVGLLALLIPLSALFTVIIFALARVERATRRSLTGAAIGMAGVALAMAPGAALPDPALLPWAALMLLTPLCYAASNLFSLKLAVPGSTRLAQATGTVILAAAGAAALALPLGHLAPPPSLFAAGILLVQGVVTAVAYLLYFRLLFGAGGVFTSQISYVITLAGLFWGFVLFAEVPGWLTIPAAALIFAGVAMVTMEKREKVTPPDASARSPRS